MEHRTHAKNASILAKITAKKVKKCSRFYLTFSRTYDIIISTNNKGENQMKYGYCRCSTSSDKQDIERQIRELKSAGAEMIFAEYEHGDAPTKKELEKLFSVVGEGDEIYTTEVSRLSRSTKQLCDIIQTIKDKRLKLVILNSITIDCSRGEIDPMTRAFLEIAGVFAELELSMTRERVKSGIENARAKGATLGRPRTTIDTIPDSVKKFYSLYQQKKINATEYAKLCGIGRTSLYKYLAIME